MIGGDNSYEGRVEVLINNRWGAVCDSDWTTADAIVVCRQLNLPYGAVEALGDTQQFGLASGQVWLQQIRCTGSEANLSNCKYGGRGPAPPIHSNQGQSVGVVCKDGMSVYWEGCVINIYSSLL